MGTRLNRHASLLSFQTQEEQTVFIRQKVGKAVARVQKKNFQDEGQFVCPPDFKLSTCELILNKLTKEVFHISKSRSDIQGLQRPPKKNFPQMFASEGDAHMRADAQINFLYYPRISLLHFEKKLMRSIANAFPNIHSLQHFHYF